MRMRQIVLLSQCSSPNTPYMGIGHRTQCDKRTRDKKTRLVWHTDGISVNDNFGNRTVVCVRLRPIDGAFGRYTSDKWTTRSKPKQRANRKRKEKIMPKFVYIFGTFAFLAAHSYLDEQYFTVYLTWFPGKCSFALTLATNSHKWSSFFLSSVGRSVFFIVVAVDSVAPRMYDVLYGWVRFVFFDCHLPRLIVMFCAWHVV